MKTALTCQTIKPLSIVMSKINKKKINKAVRAIFTHILKENEIMHINNKTNKTIYNFEEEFESILKDKNLVLDK
jgi:ribosomal protein L23